MSYSKRQYVQAALDEIGLSSYSFDMAAEELVRAVSRLDAMMASWNAKGIRLGYPLPNDPASVDPTQETGVPDGANEAIIANLALRLAPSYGKTVPPETKSVAKQAYDTLLAKAAMPGKTQPTPMLAGAGSKQHGAAAIDGDAGDINIDAGGPLEFD